jgi:hypothetical protein
MIIKDEIDENNRRKVIKKLKCFQECTETVQKLVIKSE